MNEPEHVDTSGPRTSDRARSNVAQMLGGAAIAVAVLLPLYLLDRQATALAIAKLEFELAHSKASVGVQSVPTTSTATLPASSPALAPPAEQRGFTVDRTLETAQITRALSDLARRVDALAAPGGPLHGIL